ncbi:hypothetical protein [uncultured Chryseobacterium sp.]|uniref:hypothetical protein n=1 Tax=uncultured Chryseobacterium sp. TaxID=259322 RepID=UPI0025E52D6E|nr:hypothetical protein [uncultured Chryseobacterium sp.]
MWINITKNTFQNSDFKGLNFLYQIISYKPTSSIKPRYNIAIDTEKVKNSVNFQLLKTIEPSLEEFLEAEYNVYVNGTDIPYKVTSQKGNQNYTIEEAIVFFNQPVSIVLENNKNDASFILAVIKHFGNDNGYNKVQDHIDNGWLVFENAGGCANIPNFMEGFLRKFKILAAKNSRNLFDYFRGIMIIDSDKEYQNQPIKPAHKTILDKLHGLLIDISGVLDASDLLTNQNRSIHILEKRMMENYLPKEVFQEIIRQNSVRSNSDLKDWLDIYLNLIAEEQLDFINIPDGNLYGNHSTVPTELNTLWGNLGGNFAKLNQGFKFYGFKTNGRLKSSKEGSFKSEMPNWFKKAFVTKQNLETRDGNGELQRVLDKIATLL